MPFLPLLALVGSIVFINMMLIDALCCFVVMVLAGLPEKSRRKA